MIRDLARMVLLAGLAAVAVPSYGQDAAAGVASPAKVDLTQKPSIYAVLYAHLDTQWRWEYPLVINEYLPATLHDNFALIEKYPDYVFNFTGANRYRMMKEYYPADYARLKQYVAAGHWFPGGSSMEEGDVNLPAPEAILRQILYGNEYFRSEFGRAGEDFMLPDSFGFPWSLPTLLAHSGIKGFSTGKLPWGSSVPDQPTTPYGMKGKGVPFNFGRWVGPDGRAVVSALHPGDYLRYVNHDMSLAGALDVTEMPFDSSPDPKDPPPQPWLERLKDNQKMLGLAADYVYYGIGDVGGSPNEGTVAWVHKAQANKDGAIRVLSASSDQFFRDMSAEQAAKLPEYAGEMLLTNHSAGVLTSQAYQKHWMHRSEVLADAAEKASVGAELLGARGYPQERLKGAWTLMLAGHFHDIAAGVATPKAYEYSWNDAVIAMNQLAGIVTDASEAIAGSLDTRGEGVPLVVYNALDQEREEVVEANVNFSDGNPKAVRVLGPEGDTVPAQLAGSTNGQTKVIFIARVPSTGYAVYHVQAADEASPSTLKVTRSSLENARYRVRLNTQGDIASIYDKQLQKELLSAPIRLAIKNDTPKEFPGWNMDWTDETKAPRAYVGGRAKISITEQGAARVALTVERTLNRSRFVQTIRLAAGEAGERLEIRNVIDWQESSATLKALFPLTASNEKATYNLGVGTIERATASERKFEVPSHQWIDLTDAGGAYGVTILTADKFGSDKPNSNTIGLTLLRTPGFLKGENHDFVDQPTQDWGHHEFVYGLAGHRGDWRAAQGGAQGLRLDAPLMVFQATPHAGELGKRFALLKVSAPQVRVMALKKAEHSPEYVLRVVESAGQSHAGVRVAFAAPIASVREINGQEQPIGAASVVEGTLVSDFNPYQIRSYALTFGPSPTQREIPYSQPVALAFDRAVASQDGTHTVEGFDTSGKALPAELLPSTLAHGGVRFELGAAATGMKNALAARGQTLALPKGSFNRVYVLAASAGGDTRAVFRVGDRPQELTIQAWSGYVGQWDNRLWKRRPLTSADAAMRKGALEQAAAFTKAEVDSARAIGGDEAAARKRGARLTADFERYLDQMSIEYAGLAPGFIKRAPIAWYASHHHSASGANEPYAYSYLFAYALDVPPGAGTLTLPNDEQVRVLAVTAVQTDSALLPAWPLYDTLDRSKR